MKKTLAIILILAPLATSMAFQNTLTRHFQPIKYSSCYREYDLVKGQWINGGTECGSA